MDYILENLAIGSFDEATAPAAEIDALLCVAREKDLPSMRHLYCAVAWRICSRSPRPDWFRQSASSGSI